MTKREKLLARLLRKPKDFEWGELVTLMGHMGYVLNEAKGSSHCSFFDPDEPSSILDISKPSDALLEYQIKDVINFLRDEGRI